MNTACLDSTIRPGDRTIVYLAQRSAIWGVVEITDVLLNQREPIGWLKKGWEARRGTSIEGAFPARVRFRPLCRVEPPRVIAGNGNESRNQLEYITDRKTWNVFVQIALSRVFEADVETVMRWASESSPDRR